jgi:hypothetical protein
MEASLKAAAALKAAVMSEIAFLVSPSGVTSKDAQMDYPGLGPHNYSVAVQRDKHPDELKTRELPISYASLNTDLSVAHYSSGKVTPSNAENIHSCLSINPKIVVKEEYDDGIQFDYISAAVSHLPEAHTTYVGINKDLNNDLRLKSENSNEESSLTMKKDDVPSGLVLGGPTVTNEEGSYFSSADSAYGGGSNTAGIKVLGTPNMRQCSKCHRVCDHTQYSKTQWLLTFFFP